MVKDETVDLSEVRQPRQKTLGQLSGSWVKAAAKDLEFERDEAVERDE